MSGPIRDLAERFWSGAVPPSELWKPTGQAEEVSPGVVFLHTFANMTVVRTGQGLVLVDTSNYAARARTFALVRAVDPGPVAAAIYTHGHADHALGLPPFLAEAREQGRPRPRIVGHRNVAARFARYRRTNGYNALINARQFGIAPSWPMDYDEPDVVYDTTLPLTVGEVALELHHARGETDDHTWVWWAERRILWTGDQFIWVAPNAGNPQKVQRYAADWAVSLRAMRALEPELLIPGHGVPIFGRDRVDQALADTAEWLETLERETVARMNAGRHAGRDRGRGAAARSTGRAALSAGGLRRAGLRRPQHLAAERRLVGRRRLAPEAGRRGGRRARGGEAGRRRRAAGRAGGGAGCDRGTGPGRPPDRLGRRRRAGQPPRPRVPAPRSTRRAPGTPPRS